MRLKVSLLAAAAAVFPAAALAQTPTPAPAPAQQQPAPAADSTVEAVTVTGAPQEFRSSIDRRSYSIANDLQATTGSIADALRNVPSVEVDVEGNVSLRGDRNVTILVDGKPSGMFSGEGQADALQQMPADQIERVEVMTNPSAAFRPDGSAGVINLVTKRTRKPGFTGSVRANVGTDGRYNGGVSGAYSSSKVTVSGDAGVRHDERESTSTTERARLDETSGEFIESRRQVEGWNEADGRNARLTVDYDPDSRTRISGEVRHRAMSFTSGNVESYEGEDLTGAIADAYRRTGESENERASTEFSTSVRRSFSGYEHELVVDLSHEISESNRDLAYVREELIPAGASVYEEIRNRTDQNETRLKVDYTRPMPNEATLKTGYEYELSKNDYDNFGARGASPETTLVEASLTNQFLYEQSIHAAYLTYERPFGDFTVQGGLRLEQANVDINQITSGFAAQNDYFRVYPSLHLGWELDENQQLTASYSHRVRRPRAEDLNPYRVYIDPFNYRAGNPFLEPQETHSIEVGYQYRKGQAYYLATLYYRENYNGVTDVVRDIGDGVLLTTRENLGESRSGGLELVANGRLNPKLSYNVSSNLFWNEIDASDLGFTEKRDAFTIGGRANLNWQPTAKDFFQVNAFVMGKRITPQGYREPSGMLNLGYRRKVNDKLSLVLTAQDVLDTFRDEQVIETDILRDRTVREGRGRGLFIGFTYALGDTGGQRRQQRGDPGFEFDAGAEAGGDVGF